MVEMGTNAFCVINNSIYMSVNNYNALLKIDVESEDTVILGRFPDEKNDLIGLHGACFVYNKSIYFVSNTKKKIHRYNLIDNNIETIEISNVPDSKNRYLLTDIIIDDKYYFFDWNNFNYYTLDLHSNKFEVHMEFNEWAYKNGLNEYEKMFCRIANIDNNIYLALRNTNILIRWNLEKKEGKIIYTSVEDIFAVENGFNGLVITTNTNHNVYSFNNDNEIQILYENERKTKGRRAYQNIIRINKSLLICEDNGNKIVLLKKDDEVAEKIKIFETSKYKVHQDYWNDNNKVVFKLENDNAFISIDTETFEIKKTSFMIPEKESVKLLIENNESNYISESEDIGLRQLIDYIV